MTTMQERAAKVAETKEVIAWLRSNHSERDGGSFERHMLKTAADTIAANLNTRAALQECVVMPEWDDVPNNTRAVMIKAAFNLVSGKDQPGAREWYAATRLALKTARKSLQGK